MVKEHLCILFQVLGIICTFSWWRWGEAAVLIPNAGITETASANPIRNNHVLWAGWGLGSNPVRLSYSAAQSQDYLTNRQSRKVLILLKCTNVNWNKSQVILQMKGLLKFGDYLLLNGSCCSKFNLNFVSNSVLEIHWKRLESQSQFTNSGLEKTFNEKVHPSGSKSKSQGISSLHGKY